MLESFIKGKIYVDLGKKKKEKEIEVFKKIRRKKEKKNKKSVTGSNDLTLL
jgi:hypothetical protein